MQDTSANDEDLEQNNSNAPRARHQKNSSDCSETGVIKDVYEYKKDYRPKVKWVNDVRMLYCEKCDIEYSKNLEHCEDCQVCVENLDHHCVFFSKCIAKNNIYYFWLSIGMLVSNFMLIGMSVIYFAAMERK